MHLRPWMATICLLAAAPLAPAAPPAGATDAADPWSAVRIHVPSPEDKPVLRSTHAVGGRAAAAHGASDSPANPWLRSSLALGGVVGLIVLLAWGYRAVTGGSGLGLVGRTRRPGMIEIISRTALAPRQSLCLVRIGPRMVLVGLSGERISTLDKIDDAEVVAQLAGETLHRQRAASPRRFGKLLERESAAFEPDPVAAEADRPDGPELAKVRQQLTKTIERIRHATRRVKTA